MGYPGEAALQAWARLYRLARSSDAGRPFVLSLRDAVDVQVLERRHQGLAPY